MLFLELVIVLQCILIIKKKVLREGLRKRLDDNTIAAEAKYHISFTKPERRFVSSLNYNGHNSFFFVKSVKMYQYKTITTPNYIHCF